MTIAEHIEQFKIQYPLIRPWEEENDSEWWNEGLDLLDAGKLLQAENSFKKFLLAQPDLPDGFEGLGLVYEAQGDLLKAEMFLREAASRIEQMVAKGSKNAVFLDRIQADLSRVLNNQPSQNSAGAPE